MQQQQQLQLNTVKEQVATLCQYGGSQMSAVLLAALKRRIGASVCYAYSKGGKSGLSSGSILVLVSGTLKHFTFTVTPYANILYVPVRQTLNRWSSAF